MIINDKDTQNLKECLELLQDKLMIEDPMGYQDKITFIQYMLDELYAQDENNNIILFTRINKNNGYITRVSCGRTVFLEYDKYNTKIIKHGLDTHIGEVFEMVEIDILTSKKTCYPVVLTGVRYGDGDTLDIQYSKDVNI